MDALISKATANSEDPCPGYLYSELSKLSHSGESEKLASALVSRLGKNEATVKWKVLLVMKHVSRGGSPDFKRSLQAHIDKVKECLQFRCALDPLRGDEPSRRVREAAKEALEAIFEASAPTASAGSSQLAGRITGYSGGASAFPPAYPSGSSSSSGSGPVSSQSASGMQSISSDAFSGAKSAESGSGGFAGFSAGLVGKMKAAFSTPQGTPMAGQQQGSAGGFPPAYPSDNPASKYPPADYTYARSNGTSGIPPPYGSAYPSSASSAAASNSFNPSAASSASSTSMLGRAGGAAEGFHYERSMIEELTAPGGVRTALDQSKLQAFLGAARSLNPAAVQQVLDDRLKQAMVSKEEGASVALKAMAVIEAVVSSSSTSGSGLETLRKQLTEHCDVLLDLSESKDVKPTISAAANKVLVTLGVLSAPPAPAPAPAAAMPSYTPAPAPAPAAGGLADLFGPPAPAPAPVHQVPIQSSFFPSAAAPVPQQPVMMQQQAAPAVDLFGGLSLTSGAAAPAAIPAAPAPPGFSFVGAPAAAAPAAATGFPMMMGAPATATNPGFGMMMHPQQPMMMGMGMGMGQPMMMGQQPQPMGMMGMGTGMGMGGAPMKLTSSPAPAMKPAAPAVHDPFDFVSMELKK